MRRIQDIMPPGELVHWESSGGFRLRRLLGWATAYAGFCGLLLLFLNFSSAGDRLNLAGVAAVAAVLCVGGFLLMDMFSTEVAVTERYFVWFIQAPVIGWLMKNRQGTMLLDEIRSVEIEENDSTISLICDSETHRFESLAGGQVEELARVIGRPARIWRECKSPASVRARKWRGRMEVVSFGVCAVILFPALKLFLGRVESSEGFGNVLSMVFVFILSFAVVWSVVTVARAIPHFLVGRNLAGKEQQDFVGALTDLRWAGVKPDGPDDERMPRSRIGNWAMRIAYGGIPNCGTREPEILIPGEFQAE